MLKLESNSLSPLDTEHVFWYNRLERAFGACRECHDGTVCSTCCAAGAQSNQRRLGMRDAGLRQGVSL